MQAHIHWEKTGLFGARAEAFWDKKGVTVDERNAEITGLYQYRSAHDTVQGYSSAGRHRVMPVQDRHSRAKQEYTLAHSRDKETQVF